MDASTAAPSPSPSCPRSSQDWNPNRRFRFWSNVSRLKPTAWWRRKQGNSHIRKLHAIALAAGVVLIAYSGWWWFTANALTGQVNRWIAGEQAKGAKITPMQVAVGGYPFAFAVSLKDVSLGWPGGFGFSSQALKLRTHPWALRSFRVDATGGFEVALPAGTTRPPMVFDGETLRGHASFGDTAMPIAMDLKADTVSASSTSAENAPPNRELTVTTVEFDGTRPTTAPTADTDIAYDLSLKLMGVSAEVLEGNPLGARIDQAALHAQLLGKPPEAWDEAGIKAWREAGGTVNLNSVALQWGQLGLSANGTLALDKEMQPEGAFTTHLTGYEQAIDSLAAAGWIKLSAASIAKLALGVASHPDPDGKRSVDTPLTIQNRRVSAGAIKLGQVPELKLY
jgi:hypothetical protein